MRRLGLFGGSFDPPHNAHLALARMAREQLALDELKLVPSGDPWHKRRRQLSPAADRVAMLELAIEGEPRMAIETCELLRSGPSYTVDTVEQLQALPGNAGAQWFLVIGQDQYALFDTWHRWRELLAKVTLAVAGRAGEAPRAAAALAAMPHRVVELPLPAMTLSASDVRARVRAGLSIAEVVPPAVARYIEQANLYRN